MKLRILNWDLKPAEDGGIKDANEFLLKHGKEKLRNFIIEAGQDLPVEGLVGWDVLEESFYNSIRDFPIISTFKIRKPTLHVKQT